MRLIYEEQLRGGEKVEPFNYMVEDVAWRYPWLVGDREPPLSRLYPILDSRGEFDPLCIRIGWTRTRKPFAYNPRLVVNPLVLIVGTPGAGKSATAKTMIASLLENEYLAGPGKRIPPIVVVDPEGEYADLKQLFDPKDVLHIRLGRSDRINLFDRPSKAINPFSWYMRLVPIIQRFLGVTEAQAGVAYRVLKRMVHEAARARGITEDPSTWRRQDITLEDVYNKIVERLGQLEAKRKRSLGEAREYRGLETLAFRLDQWMHYPNDAFSKQSTFQLHRVFDYKLVVLDAAGLDSSLYRLFTYWITMWFYAFMLEKGPLPSFGLRVVLMLDEAWSLLQRHGRHEENPLEGLARRGRKYGIMIVVMTQTPEDVDKKLFSLFGTLVVGSLVSDSMVKMIVESRAMPESFKGVIKTLGQGELVWSINWRQKDFPMAGEPIIVKTDYPLRESVQLVV